MKVVFLGTNGWYDTATGNTISVLIDAPEAYVVLDAGNGLSKLDQYVKDRRKPIYLFLSHFHFDHIIGLHTLAKFRFKQGITIVGQKGTKRVLARLLRQPFTLALKDLKTKVRIKELVGRRSAAPFLVAARKLKHVSSCYGFRFRLGGKIISYIPDTGSCDNALRLADRADLLITECAFKAGQSSQDWPHLNPLTAARLANRAGARRLLLAHFDAAIYRTSKERGEAERQARRIHQNTKATSDGYTETIK